MLVETTLQVWSLGKVAETVLRHDSPVEFTVVSSELRQEAAGTRSGWCFVEFPFLIISPWRQSPVQCICAKRRTNFPRQELVVFRSASAFLSQKFLLQFIFHSRLTWNLCFLNSPAFVNTGPDHEGSARTGGSSKVKDSSWFPLPGLSPRHKVLVIWWFISQKISVLIVYVGPIAIRSRVFVW